MLDFIHHNWCPLALLAVTIGFACLYKYYLYRLLQINPILLRHFIGALILGATLELALHAARDHSQWLRKAETSATDWVMNLWVLSEDLTQYPDLVPFTWITIDQETYREWDEPLTIPRDKLWQLIARAIEEHARLIIADIQLDRRSEEGGDKLLKDCLTLYKRLYSAKTVSNREVLIREESTCFTIHDRVVNASSLPPILFPVSLRPPGEETMKEDVRLSTGFLEDTIGDPPLLWTSPRVFYDDDFILREWNLFVETCDGRAIPSIPLQTWAFFRLNNPEQLPWLGPMLTKEFGTRPCGEPDNVSERSISLADKSDRADKSITLSRNPSYLEQRMIYPIGNIHDAGGNNGCTPVRNPNAAVPLVKIADHPQPILTCLSARDLTSTRGLKLARAQIPGTIAVIGATYAESRDFHLSPTGRLPGSLWVINATAGLMKYGQLREDKGMIFCLVLVGLLIFTAWLFGTLMSLWAAVFGLAGLIMLIMVSIWRFQSGVWLDFSLPFFGILGHRAWAILIEDYQGFKRVHHNHE